MDWRAEAEGKLKEYRARKQALTGLRAELQRAKIELEAAGGTETALTAKATIEELRNRLKWARLWVLSVDGALEVLSERERHILNCFFIDHPAKGGVAALCSTLGSTKEEVYKLKERALRHFTLALYGISDG